jgi:RND family efflux transporter MFP subunit
VHVFSRYVVPGVLALGFLAMTLWTTRDVYLSKKRVAVIPVHISLATVQSEGTPLFKAAGWVEPRPTPIRVAALASGVVEELLVVQDESVEAGQPIARLVAADAELAVQQAAATLELREAELREAEASLAAAQINLEIPAHLELPLAEAAASLAAIETELTNLPQQLERAKARQRLAKVDREAREKARVALSTVDLAQAHSEYDAALAEVQELTNRLPLLQQQRAALEQRRDAAAKRLNLKTDEKQALATAHARVAAARARVTEAKVAVDKARLRLDRMVIPAPIAGRILQLLTTPGSQLMTGPSQMETRDTNTVVTMYQPDHLQVRVDVRFDDLPRVTIDQPVLIESPALSSPLDGRVLFLTGFANIQKNTLEVKVSLEQPPDVLKPEMLVDVTFLAPPQDTDVAQANDEHRLYLPKSVVRSDPSGPFVWVADLKNGIARQQRIETDGANTSSLLEITSGLNEASRVIVSGVEGLRDGDRITMSKESQNVAD